MECKCKTAVVFGNFSFGINRYIVECKSGKSHTDEYFEKELIDT